MSDNVDEVTPVSPSPSAPMSGVTAAVASSVEPVSAPVDPTMAALFDTVRARSLASVAPPPGPFSTQSGYVSFTGIVRRSVGVATNDPDGVIGAPAETPDRLLTIILKRPAGRSVRVSISRGTTFVRANGAKSCVYVRSRSPWGQALPFTPVFIWTLSKDRS